MNNLQHLLDKYGLVLTLRQVAEVLSRKPDGLRQALVKKERWVTPLNESKRYIGNKLYFPVEVVAELLNGSESKDSENDNSQHNDD